MAVRKKVRHIRNPPLASKKRQQQVVVGVLSEAGLRMTPSVSSYATAGGMNIAPLCV